jgi:hypothetical protein
MFDFLPALITTNLLVTVFYASYNMPTSPIYKNKWKSLLGVTMTALLGTLLVLIHIFKKDKAQ